MGGPSTYSTPVEETKKEEVAPETAPATESTPAPESTDTKGEAPSESEGAE